MTNQANVSRNELQSSRNKQKVVEVAYQASYFRVILVLDVESKLLTNLVLGAVLVLTTGATVTTSCVYGVHNGSSHNHNRVVGGSQNKNYTSLDAHSG